MRLRKKRLETFAFVTQILFFLALNWGGDRLTYSLSGPIWLDSLGTVLCAYSLGPWCGAMVGVTSNLLAHVLYGVSGYYALVSAAIALVVGFAARKGKLETLLDTLTTCMILTAAVILAAYPINLTISGSSTGNVWGDAVIGYLSEHGVPKWIGLIAGELYVELLDKMAVLLLLFMLVRIRRGCLRLLEKGRQRRKARNLRTEEHSRAARTAALMAALALGLSALTGGLPSRAEEEPAEEILPEINYSDYVQTVYSTTNGLPCGEANDIAMTGDGIIWIGTYAGLYRYNGREFTWMNQFDSVRNVNCLYVDEEGRLWVGTNDNGLSILIGEQVVNVVDQSRGLPSNSVKSIIRSSDGYYYIGTTGSLQVLSLNNGLSRVGTIPEIVYADHAAADGNGNVAVVDNDGILFLLRQGQIVSSRRLPGDQEVFKSCAFDADGNLLAGTTQNRIFRFRISGGNFKTMGRMECDGLLNIKNMRCLDSGTLFVCADNGIAYLDQAGEYHPINTNDFNNSIDNMLVDYQGNLWFTSSRLGLLRMAASDFRDVYSTAGMDRRVVNTIVQWQGICYFGTDKGMDAVSPDGKEQIRDELTERFSGIRIRCMMVDRDDHLWVCTYGGGLVERTPDGTEYRYNQENGAFGNRARVVQQLKDGTILAAGDTGLSFIRDHQVEQTIGRADGAIGSMVLSITEMPDGTIVAGTDGDGLAVLEDRKVKRLLTRDNGLSSEVILRTVPDPASDGLFVVTSNGLCYMNPDESIRSLDNFPYYNNYDIWTAGNDQLYVLSSAGIYIVSRDELLSGKENISADLMDARRGLSGSLTANAWTWYSPETGELYLPCDTGVFVLRPENVSSGAKAYRMHVKGIRADGEDCQMRRNGETRIPRGVTKVEILPEVINYTIQDPSVGYWLEGFDSEWTIVPHNSLNTITYTNLPAGSFVFHLAVFDGKQENLLAERTYAIAKEKALYDNNWFLIYVLSVPMFTVFWVTWLLIRRREERMERELAEANRQIEMGKQTVAAIARTVDAKDERTSEHSKRVALYSKQIAKACHLSEKECQDIEWTALMHDIGKIGIPDRILNKDSRLTDEEYAVMKTHTTRGAEILKDFTLLDNVVEGAEYHHERYDGRGYPKGLKGEEIPLFARIIGVADAFDAMTANRVYRKQMDFSYVLGELERGRGTQFDPRFVDALLKLIEDGTIDLNRIYHVSREDTEQAEKAAAEARAAKEQQAAKEPQDAAGNAQRGGKA